ncbi:MAG: indole-3-glycerol phosphate synthase TrpC [Pseudohongiellaceae bacterium]
MTTTILEEILAHKRTEVDSAKQQASQTELEYECKQAEPVRGFTAALEKRIAVKQLAIIAEIKKASPSQGVIRDDFQPQVIAADYAANGATCLSILTDEKYFQGSDNHLRQGRVACNLPVLRKDFIIDVYQIAQSRLMGADCILLIVAALQQSELLELANYANELEMDVLVEVHNETELERALELPTRLIGINNRDLHSFKTDLATTTKLLPRIPADRLVITESGIHTANDIKTMLAQGVYGFLIGELFMRAPNPGDKLKVLLASASAFGK